MAGRQTDELNNINNGRKRTNYLYFCTIKALMTSDMSIKRSKLTENDIFPLMK